MLLEHVLERRRPRASRESRARSSRSLVHLADYDSARRCRVCRRARAGRGSASSASTARASTSSKKRIAPSTSISQGVPIVCMRSQRQPPTSGAVTLPPWIGRTYGSSGSRGHVAAAVAAQHAQEPLAREGGRRRVAHAQEPVAVEGGEARRLADRDVERRDVREADERLRVGGDHVEVEVRKQLRRAVAALEALDERPPPDRRTWPGGRPPGRGRRRRRSRRGRGRAPTSLTR